MNTSSKINKAVIIGAGAWGTAIAKLLAPKLKQIYLVTRDKDLVKSINNKMVNNRSLPDIYLDENIIATSYIEVANEADIIFFGCDFAQIPQIAQRLSNIELKPNCQFVILSKGIHKDSLELSCDLINQYINNHDIFVLSGPNYAKEVADKMPSIATLAGPSNNHELSNLLINDRFKLDYTEDIIGAQLCGSLKNVLAIGCGIIDGLNSSYNSKAFLFYKGFNEIIEILKIYNANTNTINLACGIGDLFLTCSNANSRNYYYGKNLVLKEENDFNKLVEGVNSSQAILTIQKQYNIHLPVFDTISRIINENLDITSLLKL